jgi:ADYC domain
MTKRSLIFVTCFVCSTALALGGDNTHNQGVSLAGRGLDVLVPGTPAPWVPYFSASWPLPEKATTYETKLPDGDKLQILASCSEKLSPIPITDNRFAFCTGDVSRFDPSGSPKRTPACGLDDSKTGKVNLLAIHARWTSPGTGNRFGGLQFPSHSLPDGVTFACAPVFPKGTVVPTEVDRRRSTLLADVLAVRDDAKETPQSPLNPRATIVQVPPEHRLPSSVFVVLPMTLVDLSNIDTSPDLGVLAKCYYWGFAKGGDDQGLLTYQACVRAARADYCGNGESHTRVGTKIQIYETPETKYGKPIHVSEDSSQCPLAYLGWTPCFEAIWDQSRALCISHARYRQMPPRGCQKELFKHEVFLTQDGFETTNSANALITLNCSPGAYKELAQSSFVKNRSGINDLTREPKESASCWNNIQCP